MALTTQPEKPRRLPAQQRREQILEGAMKVFAQRGYQDASMIEIARAGGVTAAVIYDHFASKQELHGLLLEAQTDALLAHVGGAVAPAGQDSAGEDPAGADSVGADPAAFMRAGVNAFFEFVEANPYAWRLIFREAPTDPGIADVHRRIHERATGGIAALLQASAPEFLSGDPRREQALELFAQMLKMSLNGMAVWWYEHPDVSRGELVARVLEFCWTGLERLAQAHT